MSDDRLTLLENTLIDGHYLLGYLWLLLLAIWGGTANYLARTRRITGHVFNMMELMGEWAISGFAGLLTAYLCAELGLSYYLTAVATGIAGHMGGRALTMMETLLHKYLSFKGDNDR